jgi:hypothetical protein
MSEKLTDCIYAAVWTVSNGARWTCCPTWICPNAKLSSAEFSLPVQCSMQRTVVLTHACRPCAHTTQLRRQTTAINRSWT